MSAKLKISENQIGENTQVSLVVPEIKKGNIIPFEDETFKSISKLENVLRRIKIRMKNDGFIIKNDIITKI